MATPTTFDAERCLSDLERIEADLTRLTAGLTEAGFHAPPRTGGWPVGYCIEHLSLTGYAFLPKFDLAIKEAAQTGRKSALPLPYSWLHRKILEFYEPPYRIKSKTARGFEPVTHRPMEEVVRRFLAMHRELAGRLQLCRGIDAGAARVQSPFAAWAHYPLGFSFDLALTHERRHLWQASRTGILACPLPVPGQA